MSMMGIIVNKEICRNHENEDGTLYELAYEDKSKTMFFIVDVINARQKTILNSIGLKESKFGGVHIFNSFYA